MEVNDLTTDGTDQHVNSEEQDTLNEEVAVVNEGESQNVDDSISNEQAETDAYNDAWDKTDINDDKVFDDMFSTTNDAPENVPAAQSPDLLSEETTQGTNNNIGAFMVSKPVLKYKGKDIPIDNEAELISLAQKGFSFENEMANIKPHKKAIKIIDGIPLEVLQAVADVHSGNKEAINFIKSQYGIEETQAVADNSGENFWDGNKEETPAPEKSTYKPEMVKEDPVAEFWSGYANQNQASAANISEVYGSLDESFKTEVYKQDVFPSFVKSVESGEFDQAYPIAIKEKSLNPAMTWIQAYGVAVQKIGVTTPVQTEPPASATPPSNSNQPRHVSEDAKADQVWNDDAYFKSLEDKLFA